MKPSSRGALCRLLLLGGLPLALLASTLWNPRPGGSSPARPRLDSSLALPRAAAISGIAGIADLRVTRVFPDSASPGMIVRVTTDRPVFMQERVGPEPFILIGGQQTTIHRLVNQFEADVMVPLLRPGGALVIVVIPKAGQSRPGRMRVLPARSQRLVLSLRKGQVQLLSARPQGGEFGRLPEQDQRRLSFDVFNRRGAFVHTGAVVHPTAGRIEVFEDPPFEKPARIHGEAGNAAGFDVFFVKIPNMPGDYSIRFFDAAAGLNLTTEEGRADRQFLNEIRVEGMQR